MWIHPRQPLMSQPKWNHLIVDVSRLEYSLGNSLLLLKTGKNDYCTMLLIICSFEWFVKWEKIIFWPIKSTCNFCCIKIDLLSQKQCCKQSWCWEGKFFHLWHILQTCHIQTFILYLVNNSNKYKIVKKIPQNSHWIKTRNIFIYWNT